MRRSFQDAVIVVSGAGGGLGRALVLRFARTGARVAALDRDTAALASLGQEAALAADRLLTVACDVSDETACSDAIAAVLERWGRLDVLVNNAGISHRSAFESTGTAVLRRVMEVNLFGAIHLTRPALPALRRARGLVIAISSVAGYTPLIARTGYAASKHALHGFFGSLRSELAPSGVEVMLVCPSFIATAIDRNALGPDGAPVRHAQVVVGRRLSADEVAARIVAGAARGRRQLLIGGTAVAAWWLSRFAPVLYDRIMARRLRDELAP